MFYIVQRGARRQTGLLTDWIAKAIPFAQKKKLQRPVRRHRTQVVTIEARSDKLVPTMMKASPHILFPPSSILISTAQLSVSFDTYVRAIRTKRVQSSFFFLACTVESAHVEHQDKISARMHCIPRWQRSLQLTTTLIAIVARGRTCAPG